ncbi:hypothetical protein BaRGS_00023610 [Batillaria attramentaria]|uniref:Pre-mRNA splicing factor component Cdc5p/Cef1 C-terminal domain-containing protein n=1 Tax=Batillaria attramentaria TaxID=370345 RepID=A0ABD0KDJ6_9CAEN
MIWLRLRVPTVDELVGVSVPAGARDPADIRPERRHTSTTDFQEPVKKRSKLLLPSPQISDSELEEVVKLGQASEYARQQVEDAGNEESAAKGLLLDYGSTPTITSLCTPRTPATQDSILQEAQNIMALTNVDTPLKGGLNIPLHDSDFSGVTPCPATVQTLNTVLGTPYHTPGRGEAAGMTPMPRPGTDMTASGGMTPSQTPLRDKLNINQMDEEAIVQGKFYQRQEEMRRRSLAVQRDLPHPVGINSAVLCPTGPGEPPLTELQKQLGITPGSKKPPSQKGVVNQAQHLAYLEQNPYDKFDDDDLQAARDQLKEEMQVVKEGMGHGKLSIDSFSQVWKECYTQLLFLPAQNRYIRCITHQQEKTHPVTGKTTTETMTRDAKHATKLEKKLKILLGGYQSKGRIKQMTDLSDQLEHTYLEMKTFKNL